MDDSNCYEDANRADAYATLAFSGTYYLAYRDLPELIRRHVRGRTALDYGCGTGRSTRFLRQHGFAVVGVDIAEDMIAKARQLDPAGDYRLIREDDLADFEPDACDLALSAFTFDNIPTMERKVRILRGLGRILRSDGTIINVVSSPEIYLNEWASFSTRDYPENRHARSGDRVRIVITDIEDERPVEDVVWSDESYREVFTGAGLELIETHRPLGNEGEPYRWVNETRIAPWVVYVLRRARRA